MSLPHLMFLGWFMTIRIFFPSVVRWIAHDTYITAFLSVGYPLFSTIMWIHARRNPQHQDDKTRSKSNHNEAGRFRNNDENSNNDSMVSSGNLRKRKSLSNTQKISSSNSNVPAAYDRSNLAVTRNGASIPTTSHDVSTSKEAVVYWLRYWHCVRSHCAI